MDLLKYTVLDDTTHIIGAGEYTVCGQVVPFGNGYSTDQPKKLCGDCEARATDTTEFGLTRQAFRDNQAPTPFAAPEPAPVEEPDDKPKPKATGGSRKA